MSYLPHTSPFTLQCTRGIISHASFITEHLVLCYFFSSHCRLLTGFNIRLRFIAFVYSSSCLTFWATASGTAPRPSERIVHIEILPRQPNVRDGSCSPDLDSTSLQHSHTFHLTLSTFGRTYNIHLRPDDHLIHPAARIPYYTPTLSDQIKYILFLRS